MNVARPGASEDNDWLEKYPIAQSTRSDAEKRGMRTDSANCSLGSMHADRTPSNDRNGASLIGAQPLFVATRAPRF